MNTTNNKKLKALCFFMVRQCESNGNEAYNMDDAASYAAARKKGINVDYYQSLVSEC